MTKSELIRSIAERFPNMFLKDVQIVVDAIFDEISESLASNKRIELRGFGAFTLRTREARKARNPRTNEMVELRERVSLYFRAGKELNSILNDA